MDRDPYRVWASFELAAPSEALYEVDALAITDNGVHLIEVKSHPGEIGGDSTTWQWVTPEGRRLTVDDPRSLANRKANALKEVLSRTKAFAKRRSDVRYVSEVIFLSDPDLKVTLSPAGRHQVFGRDAEPGEEIPSQRRSIGGIVEDDQPEVRRLPARLAGNTILLSRSSDPEAVAAILERPIDSSYPL